jgi:hypothetical protein
VYGHVDCRELASLAIDSLLGDRALSEVSLLELHQFLWLTLPVSWDGDTADHLAVAHRLGRLFSQAGMEHHATLCTSPMTVSIIGTYQTSGREAGRSSYRELVDATGLLPPDTGLLQWNQVKGPDERAAFTACAKALESAIDSGELAVAERRWKAVRAEVTERTLRGEWLARVESERLTRWADRNRDILGRRRTTLLSRLKNSEMPPADAYPTLRWLLARAESGIELSPAGHLPATLVSEAVTTFGWSDQLIGTLDREHDVLPLRHLHDLARTQLQAVRRSGPTLELTTAGKSLLTDPQLLHERASAALVADDGDRRTFGVAAREDALAVLLGSGPRDGIELLHVLTPRLEADGWHFEDPDLRLDEELRREIAVLRYRLWALSLLDLDGGRWSGPLMLNWAGKAAALTVLRKRALAAIPDTMDVDTSAREAVGAVRGVA